MSDNPSPATAYAEVPAPLPFWISLGLIPLAWIAAVQGGWTIALLPLLTFYVLAGVDAVVGTSGRNADPGTETARLTWHRAITLIWVPLQLITIFGILAYVSATDHMHWFAEWALFAALGILSGTIGINYSHELMHQQPKGERLAADVLLASVLYGHFRSEHLLVHHRHVGTPKDAVTAPLGEGFHRFFPRVLRQSLISAFRAEATMLARRNRPWWHRSNPFWRYWTLEAAFLILAFAIGGLWGLFLFTVQAFWAVFQLELVNYIEHYGLTRRRLGPDKWEPVRAHHSWNADHKASNWLLINLQRHSDHHIRPDRRYPLLQDHPASDAPKLPASYPIMTALALIPPLWRRLMNPRVRDWRRQFYPDITDWSGYDWRGQKSM